MLHVQIEGNGFILKLKGTDDANEDEWFEDLKNNSSQCQHPWRNSNINISLLIFFLYVKHRTEQEHNRLSKCKIFSKKRFIHLLIVAEDQVRKKKDTVHIFDWIKYSKMCLSVCPNNHMCIALNLNSGTTSLHVSVLPLPASMGLISYLFGKLFQNFFFF